MEEKIFGRENNLFTILEEILDYFHAIDEYAKFNINVSYWHGVYCTLSYEEYIDIPNSLKTKTHIISGWSPDNIEEAIEDFVSKTLEYNDMVNQEYLKRLEQIAHLYQQFMELDITERKWLKPLIHKTKATTIEMLELIEENELTYEEIGDLVGINSNTVRQKLSALSRGGYPISLTDKTAISSTGRPRNLVRKEK